MFLHQQKYPFYINLSFWPVVRVSHLNWNPSYNSLLTWLNGSRCLTLEWNTVASFLMLPTLDLCWYSWFTHVIQGQFTYVILMCLLFSNNPLKISPFHILFIGLFNKSFQDRTAIFELFLTTSCLSSFYASC